MIKRGEWHHLGHVLGTITALVNSAPPAAEADTLIDLESLQKFIKARVITEVEPPTLADLEGVHGLRSQLRAAFVAPDDDARKVVINRLLAAAPITPRITDHDGLGMHLHYFAPYSTLPQHLLADCAMALATLVTTGDGNRLRVCAAADCARVMVDRSRNRSRTFCDSGRCANRINAAAYRERQRQQV